MQTSLHRKLAGLAALALFALALPLAARADDRTVMVYTPLKSFAVKHLATRFTEDTGIRVETVQVNTGTILRRVQAESGNPRGDVMLSLGGADLQAASNLIEPYTSTNAGRIAPAFRVKGLWTPFSAATVVVIANTEAVPEKDRPQSWQDLADPKWKGKIASTRADQSGNAFQALATVLGTKANIEDGWTLYGKLLSNFVFAESAGEVARIVNDGELPLGITLEDNALDYVKGKGPVAILYPAEGTSVVPDGMAIIKGAPHMAEAKALIDWMLSQKAQSDIVTVVGRRPVTSDVSVVAEGTRPFDQIKRVPYDFDSIGAQSADWVARWKKLRSAN